MQLVHRKCAHCAKEYLAAVGRSPSRDESSKASVVGFTCWNLGVMRIGPKTAGYFGNLFPAFGAALGILLLGEPFRWFHAVGGIVTLSGIYLAMNAPAKPPTATATPNSRTAWTAGTTSATGQIQSFDGVRRTTALTFVSGLHRITS